MENWTNFSSGTSESAVMRAATGFLSVSGPGVLVGELTHDSVGHLLRLGEGAEDCRKEAGSYETEDTGPDTGASLKGRG